MILPDELFVTNRACLGRTMFTTRTGTQFARSSPELAKCNVHKPRGDVDQLSFKDCFRILKTRLPECDLSNEEKFSHWYAAVFWEISREQVSPRRNRINPRAIKQKYHAGRNAATSSFNGNPEAFLNFNRKARISNSTVQSYSREQIQ